MNIKSGTFVRLSVTITIILLLAFAGITIYVDPLFHYHGPVEGLQYPLYDERYMNDGIVKHFDYNCIITGTSMTENLKPSIWDSYYGTLSVKVPFSGGTFKEINSIVEQAFRFNPKIEYVVRGLDGNKLLRDKDDMDYEDYPTYLYDRNPFNDVKYILSKDIYATFTEYVFTFMRLGGNSTSFDTYKNWSGLYEYSAEAVLQDRERKALEEKKEITEYDIEMLIDNLRQNVIQPAIDHPDTQFYYFIPPYSICFYDDLYRSGELERYIDAWEIACRELVRYDNIKMFSYMNMADIVTDLNNYRDSIHYGQNISDYMLESMQCGIGRVESNNLEGYLGEVRDFYLGFDYDTLYN